ncbi:uncharacterized protein LOC125660811 isoform X2 [Ostrea edulis]|uniref:uncharacterized protein LOC125660811 isoform X2 n=1 Tax=Ostrea edulis TaxID=37623 RepID=UPI0024AEEC13|nr:uncharacterized protein LOC125660811 isoform X2 [Ostrea edulis]
MASFRILTGLFLLVPVQCFVNLANNSAFPATTVSTSQALDSVQIRTTVGNNENTCYQFNGREEWMRIWLGENDNVGTLTITSTTPVSWKTAITIKAYNVQTSSVDSIQQNGKLLYPMKNSSPLTSSNLDITVNDIYRGFFLYNQSINGNLGGLVLCEVTILGCNVNGYGNCSAQCPLECKDQHCDAFDGKCIHGCQNDRMIVPDCNECKRNYFGQNCTSTCGHCKPGASCDKTTGACPHGCQYNWSGSRLCVDGFYGLGCSEECGRCRYRVPCDPRTGNCTAGCEGTQTPPLCKVFPDSNNLVLSNNDRGPSSGLYVVIGVITTLLVVAVSVIAVLVYVNQKLRKQVSQRYVSQPEPPVGHDQMTEPRDYDKLGVRQTDEYMEITASNDHTPRDSGSNYVNEAFR